MGACVNPCHLLETDQHYLGLQRLCLCLNIQSPSNVAIEATVLDLP